MNKLKLYAVSFLATSNISGSEFEGESLVFARSVDEALNRTHIHVGLTKQNFTYIGGVAREDELDTPFVVECEIKYGRRVV